MPILPEIPGSQHGRPCDGPTGKPAAKPRGRPKPMPAAQEAECRQQLTTILGEVAAGYNLLCIGWRNRIARPLGACRVWLRKITGRSKESVQEAMSCAAGCYARMVSDCRTRCLTTCDSAGRCWRLCSSRCVLRETGELGGVATPTGADAPSGVPCATPTQYAAVQADRPAATPMEQIQALERTLGEMAAVRPPALPAEYDQLYSPEPVTWEVGGLEEDEE